MGNYEYRTKSIEDFAKIRSVEEEEEDEKNVNDYWISYVRKTNYDPEFSSTQASGLLKATWLFETSVTPFFSDNLDEKCNKVLLIIQKMQSGNDTDRFDEEIVT